MQLLYSKHRFLFDSNCWTLHNWTIALAEMGVMSIAVQIRDVLYLIAARCLQNALSVRRRKVWRTTTEATKETIVSLVVAWSIHRRGSLILSTREPENIIWCRFVTLKTELHGKMSTVLDSITIFTVRCYASAVLAMALCLSVRLSVRHKSVFY